MEAPPDVAAVLVCRELPRRAPRFAHRAARSLLARLDGDGADPGDFAAQRAAMEAGLSRVPLMGGVKARTALVGGVPGRWLTPRRTRPGVLAYLHGGGYTLGSSMTHAPGVALLVAKLGVPAFVPDYRLAPEHPYPAALEDASAVLGALVADHGADRVVVAGDSAGGGLALASMLAARGEGGAQPAAAWLLCPWVDLTMTHSAGALSEDGELRADGLRRSADAYAGEATGHPLISPLYAELAGLPPLLFQTGQDDPLGLEAELLAARAVSAGVEVRLEAYEAMGHVFQLRYAPFPEAVAARRSGVAFLASHLAA